MKKTAIIGIVILIVMFVVTCDVFQPEDKVEYTDVEYSEDGSRVTIYLDGVGVPKTAAQRAMSTRLSKMAYDYLEAIFISNTAPATTTNPIIARAQWELGQSAGISGVNRGPTTPTVTGVDYKCDPATSVATAGNVALLAVGRKDGKTLLGIGEIMEVDNSASKAAGTATGSGPGTTGWVTGLKATGEPNTIWATIYPNSKSVTFYITSVKTGLLVEKETTGAAGTSTNPYGIMFSSFVYSPAPSGTDAPWKGSTRTELGSSQVPTYPLVAPTPTVPNPPVEKATYTFSGAALTYKNQIKTRVPAGTKAALVEPRFPRYQYNGQYRQLSAAIDMRSDVITPVTFVAYDNVVPLEFTARGSGIFSFYIEMPVYILTDKEGTNTGKLSPVGWNIRTGLGSELYSLDDGVAGGGCVLMTIGTLDLEDWLEIQWVWLP